MLGEHYAGAALLRQVVEIEYLTWTFKEGHRSANKWLQSTHEERLIVFTPGPLRKTSKGRFLNKDYQDHCEQGGHPVSRGSFLLGGKNPGSAQVLLVDLIVHCWRTWDQVVQWSIKVPYASATVLGRGRQVTGACAAAVVGLLRRDCCRGKRRLPRRLTRQIGGRVRIGI